MKIAEGVALKTAQNKGKSPDSSPGVKLGPNLETLKQVLQAIPNDANKASSSDQENDPKGLRGKSKSTKSKEAAAKQNLLLSQLSQRLQVKDKQPAERSQFSENEVHLMLDAIKGAPLTVLTVPGSDLFYLERPEFLDEARAEPNEDCGLEIEHEMSTGEHSVEYANICNRYERAAELLTKMGVSAQGPHPFKVLNGETSNSLM